MLSLSIKSKYGLSILFELALRVGEEPIQIRELSKLRDVPHTYLEQILVTLRLGGFVRSFRGAKGGYVLGKLPSEIKVSDVLLVLEGPLSLSQEYCGCDTLQRFWGSVEGALSDVLSTSLADLISDKQKIGKMLTYTI